MQNSWRRHVNQFDVVILDTAPTVLVTDSLIMDDLVDLVLYVVRSGHTEKQLTDHIQNLHKSGKMQRIALLLNDVKQSHAKGYNYGYGYGYSEEKKQSPWYKRILKQKNKRKILIFSIMLRRHTLKKWT